MRTSASPDAGSLTGCRQATGSTGRCREDYIRPAVVTYLKVRCASPPGDPLASSSDTGVVAGCGWKWLAVVQGALLVTGCSAAAGPAHRPAPRSAGPARSAVDPLVRRTMVRGHSVRHRL